MEVRVQNFSSKGIGIAHSEKGDVEIPGSLPGELIGIEVISRSKGRYVGKLLQILEASKIRVPPRCAHAKECGGCSFQHASYEGQLEYKKKTIEEFFPGVDFSLVASSNPFYYRNKMEYTFSQNKNGDRFLGLMMRGSKGRVLNLSECHIADLWFVSALETTFSWWKGLEIEAFHPMRGTGSLRHLTLRQSQNSKEKMAILTVNGDPQYAIKQVWIDLWVSKMSQMFPNISLFLFVHQAMKGKQTQIYEMHLSGKDSIEEILNICENKYYFSISPSAFFQPNSRQAELLYEAALSLMRSKQRKLVLDLYAGTATLGILFASCAKKVISIELNPYAVFDAEKNREKNRVSNLEIIQGDVAKILNERFFGDPDLIILDPPRSGLTPQAIESVIRLNPQEILYISCAPKTQARDCDFFLKSGYEIEVVQPVDQFPQTYHIENIVLLRKRSVFP